MKFIGMNNFGHHSSVALVGDGEDYQIWLRERYTQKKSDRSIHWAALANLKRSMGNQSFVLAETSCFKSPEHICEAPSTRSRLVEASRLTHLEDFFRFNNPNVRFFTHHYCHAMAAIAMSPMKSGLVLVTDGAGSAVSAFDQEHPEIKKFPQSPGVQDNPVVEVCTAYLFDGFKLECIHKEWQQMSIVRDFGSPIFVCNGLGNLYENAAKYIFGDFFDAGKVMGLAAFAEPTLITSPADYVMGWDWTRSFGGRTKLEWERCPNLNIYKNIAASVQRHFEDQTVKLVSELKRANAHVEGLVMTGGCALNCLTNSAIASRKWFRQIYVPPFPGDESVALGAAIAAKAESRKSEARVPREWSAQRSDFGPQLKKRGLDSVVAEAKARGFRVRKPKVLEAEVARLLARGVVVAWMKGRSECGPRALGHRSILAHPGLPSMKAFLNQEVKGRESFRPYGGTVTLEAAHQYFEMDQGQESPFMSFAPKVKGEFAAKLLAITHVDGTSRIQTLRKDQNPKFHLLLKEFGDLTGVECLLNTSLNIMGKPLAESPSDAFQVFCKYPLGAMVVEGYLIEKGDTSGLHQPKGKYRRTQK